MKRFMCVLASGVILASGAVAIGTIVGSAHDGTAGGATWGSGQICLPCHIPHNAQKDGDDSYILWNHELTGATFAMYDPFFMDEADRGLRNQASPIAGGPSRLCLSCHDGTIALDSYGNATSTTAGSMGDDPGTYGTPGTAGSRNLGTDLRDDHPIGIDYPADGTSGYFDDDSLTDVKLVDYGAQTRRLECTSCHDPHDVTYPPFLRVTKDGSALCLKCHDK